MAKKQTEDAVAAYRQALVNDDVETYVGDLAVKCGLWSQAIGDRERAHEAERQAEDAVVAAWEKATAVGAKPPALERIGLKPTAAINAVKNRNKKRPAVSPERTAAADAPLTPPGPASPADDGPDAFPALSSPVTSAADPEA
jgi:hypothetical protein